MAGELHTKLAMDVVLTGAEAGAAQLRNLADAQERVAGFTKQSSGLYVPSDLATEIEATATAQDKLNVSTERYVSILSRIHPALGAMASVTVNTVKVAGDLANQQIRLRDVTDLAASALRRSADAIKLLGAGAIAYLGISKLIEVIRLMREEAARAREQVEALTAANTKLGQQSAEAAEQVAAGRDQAGRRRPMTAGQLESIAQTLAAAPEAARDKLGPILQALGGAAGFGPAAGAMTGRELEMLARLGFEPSPGASMERETGRARRFLDRRADDVGAIEDRDREQRTMRGRAALDEVLQRGTGPRGFANLRALTDEIAREYALDLDDFFEATKNKLTEEIRIQRRLPANVRRARAEALGEFALDPMNQALNPDQGFFTSPMPFIHGERPGFNTRPATATELTALRELFEGLRNDLRRIIEAPPGGAESNRGRPGIGERILPPRGERVTAPVDEYRNWNGEVGPYDFWAEMQQRTEQSRINRERRELAERVTIVQNNGRYYGPDGDAQRRRTRNGETRAADIEGMMHGF